MGSGWQDRLKVIYRFREYQFRTSLKRIKSSPELIKSGLTFSLEIEDDNLILLKTLLRERYKVSYKSVLKTKKQSQGFSEVPRFISRWQDSSFISLRTFSPLDRTTKMASLIYSTDMICEQSA